jgi:hypothetical protein
MSKIDQAILEGQQDLHMSNEVSENDAQENLRNRKEHMRAISGRARGANGVSLSTGRRQEAVMESTFMGVNTSARNANRMSVEQNQQASPLALPRCAPENIEARNEFTTKTSWDQKRQKQVAQKSASLLEWGFHSVISILLFSVLL